jgi:glutamine synthetase
VLNAAEVQSRYDVKVDKYCKLLNIEARVMIRMARRTYLPAISDYAANVASNINSIRTAMPEAPLGAHEALLHRLTTGIENTAKAIDALVKIHDEANSLPNGQERANRYANDVLPAMEALRAEIDGLELYVERNYWPVPTYNDMLFYC